jgi:hypothetical protein
MEFSLVLVLVLVIVKKALKSQSKAISATGCGSL